MRDGDAFGFCKLLENETEVCSVSYAVVVFECHENFSDWFINYSILTDSELQAVEYTSRVFFFFNAGWDIWRKRDFMGTYES